MNAIFFTLLQNGGNTNGNGGFHASATFQSPYGTTSPNPNYYTHSHASSIGSSSSSSYSTAPNQQQYYYTMGQSQGGYNTLSNGLSCASPSIMQQQIVNNPMSVAANLGMNSAENYYNTNTFNGQYATQGGGGGGSLTSNTIGSLHRKGNEFQERKQLQTKKAEFSLFVLLYFLLIEKKSLSQQLEIFVGKQNKRNFKEFYKYFCTFYYSYITIIYLFLLFKTLIYKKKT